MIMLERLKNLAIPLPEDIQKQEDAGYFAAAQDLIDRRLAGPLPHALSERLELEKNRLIELEGEYPFPYEQAFEMLQGEIRDFTKEEFDELIAENQVDWLYREGKMYFVRHFHENLRKVQHPVTQRLIVPEDAQAAKMKQDVLNGNMRYMKEHGGTAYYIRIRSTLKVGENGRIGEPITVHLPIPNNSPQVKNFRIHTLSPDAFVAPEDAESRTVCFQKNLEAGDEFTVEYSFENHLTYVDPDPDKVCAEQPSFCLEEEAPHIMFTPLIRAMCQEIVGDETNPLLKAKRIYEYVTDRVRYSYVRRYSTILNIPEYAAVNQKGDCGVQAVLFITLCRCAGVPARWQSGLFAAPYDIGGHDWAQFYVAPYGWLYADLSFGGSAHRLGNEERRAFYFGNLDPFRMPANLAFQHEFIPLKQFMRNDPTDNQYGECEYNDRALTLKEYNCEHTMVDIHQIG